MCTNFKVPRAQDGSVVVGRNIEFPSVMQTSLAVLPADFGGSFARPDGTDSGTGWTARHGVVGMCGFGHPSVLMDGMNTAGLSGHVLYMPHYCEYQPYRGDGTDVAETELCAWLLGTCASTEEIGRALEGKNVWGLDPGMGLVPPCHFLFHDEQSSVALEFHPDGWSLLDNPTSVATNAPYLDWHLTNLKNYVGVSPAAPTTPHPDGIDLTPLGLGQGLMGLPGGLTPPARFIRAYALTSMANPPKDAREAEQFALHVLNSFDTVGGFMGRVFGEGHSVHDATVWDTIANLTGRRYAYRTMGDPTVYVVDLDTTDFTGPARRNHLSWDGDFTAITV
jgi:choloylglycine hydrolase